MRILAVHLFSSADPLDCDIDAPSPPTSAKLGSTMHRNNLATTTNNYYKTIIGFKGEIERDKGGERLARVLGRLPSPPKWVDHVQ